MPLTVTPLYAPTAQVTQLNILPVTEELSFAHVPYGFSRRVRWKSLVQFHADARFETMPQQLLRVHEFVIQREDWTPNEIDALQALFDRVKGGAIPVMFVAPDDGVTYEVLFKDDVLEVQHPNAATRQCTITLVEAGDLDNSINNGLVYPSYVESTTTTSSSTTSTTDTQSSTVTGTEPPEETGSTT